MRIIVFSLTVIILLSSTQYAYSCYSSIFSFGDSLTDTGNLLHIDLSSSNSPPHFGKPPYGKSYFYAPTGRCSDGRLVVDFIAEYLGLPYVQPYIGNTNYSEGVNFAMVGATALSTAFFEERGFDDPFTNGSLEVQLGWFKNMLTSLSHTSSVNCLTDYKKVLKNSLIVMGEIGGNDYNHALLAGRSLEEVQSFMTPVINEIRQELINLGAVTFMVPGYLPIGCSSAYLAQFESANKEDYDLLTGCLNWLNEFAQTHNERLQIELNRIQQFNPHATIIYADFYNAAMPFYRSPKNYGFTKSTLVACCGGGGAYNYNASLLCGDPPSTSCDDPSLYANWDGLHLTDAANRIITKGLFEGPNTIPHINNFCPSKSVASS
ncbi:hypothetical protein LguiA_014925 [Lonicera macranthoides]